MNTTSHPLRSVTGASFETDVVTASQARTVVVDFSADWCGPCRALAPALADLAADPALEANIVTVDADVETDLLERFHIGALPTLLFFRHGQVVDKLVGLNATSVIREKITAVPTR